MFNHSEKLLCFKEEQYDAVRFGWKTLTLRRGYRNFAPAVVIYKEDKSNFMLGAVISVKHMNTLPVGMKTIKQLGFTSYTELKDFIKTIYGEIPSALTLVELKIH